MYNNRKEPAFKIGSATTLLRTFNPQQMFSLRESTKTYKLGFRLSGHEDAILCMAVSQNGNLLASGGIDGLRVWDLPRRVQGKKPNQTRNPRDPVTCVRWLTRKDDVQEILCAGTGLGYIIVWRQRTDAMSEFDELWSRRIGNGEEIMSLTCETFEGNPRLITSTRDRRVQLWTMDSRYHLSNVFSVELAASVPRASCFLGGDVMVFGMYDGDIHTLRSKDGALIGTQSTGRMIGGVAVDSACNCFVIDNAVTGYSLHRLDDASCVRMYDTKPAKTFPKQVVFAEAGQRIVGGGEDGKAYIFHKASGALLQVLQHSTAGRVQTITAFEGNAYYWIATASSSPENNPKISLWKKPIPSVKQPPNPRTLASGIMTATQILIHLLALGMIVVLISQTMRGSTLSMGNIQGLWGKYNAAQVIDGGALMRGQRGSPKEARVTRRNVQLHKEEVLQDGTEAGVNFILL